MIISASRRTDIPAVYSEWFMNRLRSGYVLVPNPRNSGRIGRVTLSPENVNCIVFWTKNPSPMLDDLGQLDKMGYRYYFQFTLTPYGKSVENGLPPKTELIKTFVELSERITAKRTVWRYDPIFVDGKHTAAWHIEQFSKMCEKLSTSTDRCIVSFVDLYRCMGKRFRIMTNDEMISIASGFSAIAKQYAIALYTCAEEIDLSEYGFLRGSCIDKTLIEQIVGKQIKAKPGASQRASCCCINSIDVGVYDTCPHGCSYCYATSSLKTVLKHLSAHNPKSPMLTGYPKGNEIITNRTVASQIICES